MKFYDRINEIKTLQDIEKRSEKNAQMTVITGRWRVGKTSLLKHAFTTTPVIYFFVEKKTESLLCEEFVQEIQSMKLKNALFSVKWNGIKTGFRFLCLQRNRQKQQKNIRTLQLNIGGYQWTTCNIIHLKSTEFANKGKHDNKKQTFCNGFCVCRKTWFLLIWFPHSENSETVIS